MSEYIDRESISNVLSDVCSDKNCPMYIAATVEQMIYYEPAADVAPVVHARWKPVRGIFQCSACGFGMFMDGVFFENGECTHANEQDFRLKYCPNCGAKMDKEANQ